MITILLAKIFHHVSIVFHVSVNSNLIHADLETLESIYEAFKKKVCLIMHNEQYSVIKTIMSSI